MEEFLAQDLGPLQPTREIIQRWCRSRLGVLNRATPWSPRRSRVLLANRAFQRPRPTRRHPALRSLRLRLVARSGKIRRKRRRRRTFIIRWSRRRSVRMLALARGSAGRLAAPGVVPAGSVAPRCGRWNRRTVSTTCQSGQATIWAHHVPKRLRLARLAGVAGVVRRPRRTHRRRVHPIMTLRPWRSSTTRWAMRMGNAHAAAATRRRQRMRAASRSQ